jgi:hypothetical protein
MKIAKVGLPLLALGMLLSGCSTSDANGVNISRPSFFNFLSAPPAPVSQMTATNPNDVPPSSSLVVN